MESPYWQRGWNWGRSAYERLNLTISGLAALAAGVVILGVTVILLGGVTEDVIRHNGLSTTDVLHLHWFTDHRTDVLISGSRIVSELGSPAVLALVAVAVGVWLWMRGLRLGLALAPGIAFAMAAAIATLAKTVVGRHRPPIVLHLVAENNGSFPSGHATDATAFFVTFAIVVGIFVLRRPVARAAIAFASALLAVSIGISRLILGVHWPTDVLAGWALGLGCAIVVAIVASLVAVANRSEERPRRAPIAIVLRVFDTRRNDGHSLQAA